MFTDIRPSSIAGRWYPDKPTKLAESVDAYLQVKQLPEISGEIIGIVVPHAGHIYSGPVAGNAFALLRGLQPDIVAIISPMHYPYTQALLTSGHQAYSTPLGIIPIDQDTLQVLNTKLSMELGYPLSAIKYDEEHSLEIELPFVQRVLSCEFKLLPVMIRDVNPRILRILGKCLAESLQGKSVILIASTNLSHFYHQQQAVIYDQELLKRLEMFDPDSILRAEEEGKAFACGRGALAAVLWAAQSLGANKVKILHYATSGEITGEFEQVVGYGSAVIYKN